LSTIEVSTEVPRASIQHNKKYVLSQIQDKNKTSSRHIKSKSNMFSFLLAFSSCFQYSFKVLIV